MSAWSSREPRSSARRSADLYVENGVLVSEAPTGAE